VALSYEQVRERIDTIFAGYRNALGAAPPSILPEAATAGKTYEAWVLCRVLEHLHKHESYEITLRRSTTIRLKSSPGPINRNYAHFSLTRPGEEPLEVWTDVEFLSLSAGCREVKPLAAQPCDYHELDIVVVPAGIAGRPDTQQVRIGVECKNLAYDKGMLRSLLGVRRELSLLAGPTATGFHAWPRTYVPAEPPSCLLAYGSDEAILNYAAPGELFGVDFVFKPLP
jgi:hypothetical protein